MHIAELLERESQASHKTYLSGTHRVRAPNETYEAFRPLLPRLGITRLANVTGLDFLGVPVWQAIRPNARTIAVSQGKGTSHEAAKVSAMMESIELWHAEHYEGTLRFETWSAMRRKVHTIDIRTLSRARVEEPPAGRMRLWTQGWDLMTAREIWVPHAVVALGGAESEANHLMRTSNGLASGNTLGEAIVHGLCETIERDAWSIWNASPREPRESKIDLSTVKDPSCRHLIASLRAAGQMVAVYDMTSGVGIPVFQAVICDRPGTFRPMGMYQGIGCHLDPSIALSRALTEAAQCRLTYVAGARDDVEEEVSERLALLDLGEYERELEKEPPMLRFDRPSLATASPTGDIDVLVAHLEKEEVRSIAVVSLMHEGLGIPVVKVIPSELEGLPEASPGLRAQRAMAGSEQ